MARLRFSAAAFAAVFVLAAYGISVACVGKSLTIGCVDTPSVNMVSEMMSILITERTGTTVVIKKFKDYAACYEEVENGEVDIMVDFTGRGYVDVLKKQPVDDPDKVFSEVKEVYQREMNLVWLEPFGFQDKAMAPASAGSIPVMAAPVVTKETLAKFPALPRVLNKLAGKLDDGSVAKLVSDIGDGEMADKKAEKVTRKFLKSKRLI